MAFTRGAVLFCLSCLLATTSALQPRLLLRPASSRGGAVCMGRKGRPKMPAGGAYQQGGMQQRAPTSSPDGMPLFYLYCRSGAGKPWYPVSMMKGDGQSKGLINAWLNSPFGNSVFKNRLDSGMARSIFDSERRLAKLAVEQYSHIKNNKVSLQWGYKIIDNDMMAKEEAGEIEKQKIIAVSRNMLSEGFLEGVQKTLTGFGQ